MQHSIIRSMALVGSISFVIIAISGCISSNTIVIASPMGNAGQADDLAAGLPDTVDYSIEVVGGTHSPTTLTYADLKALGLVEKSNVSYIGDDGLDYTGDFVGVPMEAILDKAGLPAGNLSYNVSAADGEHMTYTPIQAGKAILGLKKNGAALTGNITDDPLHMVLPGGPYCHWIDLPTRIEIITDQPAGYCVPGTGSDPMNACNNSVNTGNS